MPLFSVFGEFFLFPPSAFSYLLTCCLPFSTAHPGYLHLSVAFCFSSSLLSSSSVPLTEEIRNLKVVYLMNSFCENQHHCLLSFIHCRNSECRILLDDLLIAATRFTCQQVNKGSYILHFKHWIHQCESTQGKC